MDVTLFLRFVEIIAIMAVGFILKTQINSQREIIVGMKTLFDFYDINKMKDYAKSLEELSSIRSKLKAVKFLEEELSSGDYDLEFKEKYEKEMSDELFAFAYSITLSLDEEQQKNIFKTYFPKFGTHLSRAIQKHNNPSSSVQNSPQKQSQK